MEASSALAPSPARGSAYDGVQTMTDWTSWFRSQLQASGEAFAWSVEQLSRQYDFAFPPEPGYLGAWEPARHVWHVTEYERCLALPAMRQWLGGELPPEGSWPDDDDSWAQARTQAKPGC
jgi:hypothetical protein